MAKKKRSPPKKHGKRISGQATTETLVILAAVMIVAMVGISILGDGLTTIPGAMESQSRISWSSQIPLAIMESSADENNLMLAVVNNGQYPVKITGFGSSDGYRSYESQIIQPGERTTLSVNYWPLGPELTRDAASISSLSISYQQYVGAGAQSEVISDTIGSNGVFHTPFVVTNGTSNVTNFTSFLAFCTAIEQAVCNIPHPRCIPRRTVCDECGGCDWNNHEYCCLNGPTPKCISKVWGPNACDKCGGCDPKLSTCCPYDRECKLNGEDCCLAGESPGCERVGIVCYGNFCDLSQECCDSKQSCAPKGTCSKQQN